MPESPETIQMSVRRRSGNRRCLLSLALGGLFTLTAALVAPGALYGVLPVVWYTDSAPPPAPQKFPATNWSATLLRDRVEMTVAPFLGPGRRRVANPPVWYRPPMQASRNTAKVVSEATGFPFRSFHCEAHYISQPAKAGGGYTLESLRGGIQLSKTSDRFGIVPLSPIWSGLLLNILIWSAAAWLLLTLTSALRTKLRARRAGKCPHCRYDLRGLPTGAPCPECGCTNPSKNR